MQFYGDSGRSLKSKPLDVFKVQTVQSTMEKGYRDDAPAGDHVDESQLYIMLPKDG